MRVPVIKGVIDRRILVNYRVDPNVLASLLPAPFRPQVHEGCGVAGICLIRLRNIRPASVPWSFGIKSENAAHRIAVEWDTHGESMTGVFIPRRDTSSRFNAWVGGRLFPGVHHHARFTTKESRNELRVLMKSDDGNAQIEVIGTPADYLPSHSIFQSIEDASAFFERGSIGYSATADRARFDGLELRTSGWSVEPLAVKTVRSTFFEDASRFPPGSVHFDCALLMRNIPHEWHGHDLRVNPCVVAGNDP